MNIELIQREIEKLSTLVAAWKEGESVPAIERDLALEKLTSLYELVRFGEDTTPTEKSATPIIAPVESEASNEEESEEQEVEVEFIFAEDDQQEETIAEEDLIEEAEPEVTPEPVVEITPEPEPEIAPEPEPIVEPVTEEEPTPEPEPAPEPEPTPEPAKPAEKPRKPSMESLFGTEEIQRKPRSKHQRMMAIYSEPQPKQEKIVDISKIFDMDDDDENFEIEVSSNAPAEENIASNTVNDISTHEKTILADTIAPATTTIADTMAAPSALAEELTAARTKSLRQAIGINDKFLMTRDLFDGDNQAFEEAIAALDEYETLDDCMIYIVENYEWNPDSEGAKFIMQLLERKHS